MIFRKLLALGLLPPDEITQTFTWLYVSLSLNLKATLKPLFQYYLDTWIIKAGPQHFSFYKKFDCFLNCSELHWEDILNRSGGPRPNIWKFLGIIYLILLFFI